jgi:ribosomal protein S21
VVIVDPDEGIDNALRKLRRDLQRSGLQRARIRASIAKTSLRKRFKTSMAEKRRKKYAARALRAEGRGPR